jgi:F-type H+-transporting ATPase subunit b
VRERGHRVKRAVLEFPPNITAVYQAILLVVLWLVLKRLVFERILENLHKRDEKTAGALAEAKRLRDEAASLRSEYEVAMAEVRRSAARARDEIRRQAESEERGLLETARNEAARSLESYRAKIAEELAAARGELDRQADDLAEQVARTLLRQS